MIFKHRPSTEIPKPFEVQDEVLRKLLEDLGKMLFQTLRNIYDDLKGLERVEQATTLPTAAQDYRGKQMIVPTTAGHDELWICLATGTTPAHAWHKVTVT